MDLGWVFLFCFRDLFSLFIIHCSYEYVNAGDQSQKSQIPWSWSQQAIVIRLTWVWGPELWASARALLTLNHCGISVAPRNRSYCDKRSFYSAMSKMW